MNKVLLIGRLTNDPEIKYTQEGNAIARHTLAVDKKEGADFIGCVAFGKSAEFAEKYLKKGTKVAIEGRIQTGSYTNSDGKKVYTTDVVIEKYEFCESKKAEESAPANNGFEGINFEISNDEELPFGKPTR